ncbi:hypothetical protein H0H93_002497 [Arthromyces matolae]|nr:hypothetical protein H0H93_002497 [Arthromyces matolae]
MVNMRLCGTFSALLLSILSARATLIQNTADLPNTNFDFIIIGGGTAGNVLANRLTENSATRVLVLEAGPSDAGVLASQVPFLAPTLTNPSPYEWNYTTVNQTGLAGRSIAYPRGHILGGSSSTSKISNSAVVNDFFLTKGITDWLVYTRGSSEDFDRYASVTGDQGWSWNKMLPYFKKSEKWNAPMDNHNTNGQFNPALHGTDGLLGVSLPSYAVPIDNMVINATKELGGEFAYNVDYNSGKPLGIGWVQSTVLKGQRSSSSTAYLAPNFLNRPNLMVLVNTQVSRILKTSNGSIPTFLGVEFRGADGEPYNLQVALKRPNKCSGKIKQLTAKKEIILSAGSVGTPHILLNSGIGSSSALKAVGVTPLVDLPDVGSNLSDHPVIGNPWLVDSNNTFETLRRDPDPYLAQWEASKTGPYSDTILDHVGFMRVPQSSVPRPDSAAGPNSPHFELIISNGVPPFLPPQGNFLVLTTIVVSPSSRGSIKLASNNPFAAPLIDPGLLNSATDRLIMREGIKSAMKFASAPAWTNYVVGSASGLAANQTDAALDTYAAANAGTLFHPVGTASMSKKGASNGVVDPDLRLKKVNGVRVVDASVLPYVPSAHTVGPVYAVAERAADLIKSSSSY